MTNQIINRIQKRNIDLQRFLQNKKIDTLDFSTEWMFYFILERYYINLSAVKELIQNMKAEDLPEMPIGLILRASLLDSLIMLDLLYLSKDPNDLENKINIILIENITNSFSYFNYLNQNDQLEIMDLKLARENAEKLLEKLPDKMGIKNINDLTQNKKLYKSKKPYDIFKNLTKSEYKNYAKCYDYYNYYSVYEHFGILYPMLARQNINEKLEKINQSLDYIYLVIDIILDHEKKYEAQQ